MEPLQHHNIEPHQHGISVLSHSFPLSLTHLRWHIVLPSLSPARSLTLPDLLCVDRVASIKYTRPDHHIEPIT